MTPILLCGKKEDTSYASALVSVLSHYGGVFYHLQNEIGGTETPKYYLADSETPLNCSLPKGFLLFKRSFSLPGCLHHAPGLLPIFESSNTVAAAYLKQAGQTAVTYGMSSKDTISLASLSDSNAIISVQRSLSTLSGTMLEPGDIDIRLKNPISTDRLLLLAAVLLLAGEPAPYEL